MPVRSGVLGRGNSGVGGATITLATCPSTDTFIVKEVDLVNLDALAHTCQVYVSNAAASQLGYLFFGSIAPNGRVGVTCWAAMGPTDKLVFVSDGGQCYCWASGADLPGHL